MEIKKFCLQISRRQERRAVEAFAANRADQAFDEWMRQRDVRQCIPSPPVLELDPEGKVLQTWGGPGDGYTWLEHGIYIDHNGFVWTGTSNGMHVMKLTQDGKYVLSRGWG